MQIDGLLQERDALERAMALGPPRADAERIGRAWARVVDELERHERALLGYHVVGRADPPPDYSPMLDPLPAENRRPTVR